MLTYSVCTFWQTHDHQWIECFLSFLAQLVLNNRPTFSSVEVAEKAVGY
jgi:hypothetical protein